MKVLITLTNSSGGELDNRTIEIDDEDDSAETSEQIFNALEGWILAPGDTIKIEDMAEKDE